MGGGEDGGGDKDNFVIHHFYIPGTVEVTGKRETRRKEERMYIIFIYTVRITCDHDRIDLYFECSIFWVDPKKFLLHVRTNENCFARTRLYSYCRVMLFYIYK